MKKTSIQLVSVTIFIAICCSLLLPQYETLTDGMSADSFSIMSQYPNPDQAGGFFGGGYYSTFNGFGSLSTLINVVISFIITITLFYERSSSKLLMSLFILLIALHLLSLLDIIAAPLVLNEPDTLKIGFYIVRLLGMVLFYFAFVNNKQIQTTKIKKSGLIDD